MKKFIISHFTDTAASLFIVLFLYTAVSKLLDYRSFYATMDIMPLLKGKGVYSCTFDHRIRDYHFLCFNDTYIESIGPLLFPGADVCVYFLSFVCCETPVLL